MLQTKSIISPQLQDLWPPNLAGRWFTLKGSYPCYSTLWSRVLATSSYKLKPLYFYYHNAYGLKTWPDVYKTLWTMKVTRLFEPGLARSDDKLNMLYLLYHISYGNQTWQGGNMNEKLHSIKLQDPLMTWSCKIAWQIQYVISLLPQDLSSLKLGRWWVTVRGFHS